MLLHFVRNFSIHNQLVANSEFTNYEYLFADEN
jgi:hypothetical protein